jgi:hypothetical protein
MGRAAERIDRPLDLGEAEACLGHGGADVGRQHQLEAAANAVAVHRGDDWLRIWVVLQPGVVDHSRHLRPGRQIAADIGADGKGSQTGAGQDDAAAAAVALQLVPEATEFGQHLPRHGVEVPLVVDRDDGDMPVVPGETDLHHSGSSSTTTLPCARRSVSRRIASTLLSNGRRWVMHGFSLPSPYQRNNCSAELRSFSGACRRK